MMFGMPAKPITDEQRKARNILRQEVGRRLRLAREVLGLGQAEFGRRAGLSSQQYHQIETGTKLPSIEAAIALCDAHGLTLDYVLRGETSDLKHSVGRAIEALLAARTAG